jgi:hypothetical protein
LGDQKWREDPPSFAPIANGGVKFELACLEKLLDTGIEYQRRAEKVFSNIYSN